MANDSKERNLLVTKLNIRQIKTNLLLFLSLQCLYLASLSVASTIGSFYMSEAKARGSNTMVGGLVFSVYPYMVFLLSPIVGRYMSKIGPVASLIAGSFMEGIGEISFGFISLFKEQ